jgi:hypothetical protein
MKKLLFGLLLYSCVGTVQAYYAPEEGRWLNRDPIGEHGGHNLLGYIGNSPIDYFDFLGMQKACGHESACDCTCECKGTTIEDELIDAQVFRYIWRSSTSRAWHHWLVWPVGTSTGSSDANGDGHPIGAAGNRRVMVPAWGVQEPFYQTPKPEKISIQLSPCKHDFRKFWKCLSDESAAQFASGLAYGLCDAWIDDLLARCKEKSKGCTPAGDETPPPPNYGLPGDGELIPIPWEPGAPPTMPAPVQPDELPPVN